MSKSISFFLAIVALVTLASITGGVSEDTFTLPGLLIGAITATVCFDSKDKDLFGAAKWMAAFYGLSFAIVPMLLHSEELMEFSKRSIAEAQWWLLAYFCVALAGYYFFRGQKSSVPVRAMESMSDNNDQDAMRFGIAVFSRGPVELRHHRHTGGRHSVLCKPGRWPCHNVCQCWHPRFVLQAPVLYVLGFRTHRCIENPTKP